MIVEHGSVRSQKRFHLRQALLLIGPISGVAKAQPVMRLSMPREAKASHQRRRNRSVVAPGGLDRGRIERSDRVAVLKDAVAFPSATAELGVTQSSRQSLSCSGSSILSLKARR